MALLRSLGVVGAVGVVSVMGVVGVLVLLGVGVVMVMMVMMVILGVLVLRVVVVAISLSHNQRILTVPLRVVVVVVRSLVCLGRLQNRLRWGLLGLFLWLVCLLAP